MGKDACFVLVYMIPLSIGNAPLDLRLLNQTDIREHLPSGQYLLEG